MLTAEQTEQQFFRQSLFTMQDQLIEHKFPTDHIAEHEYQISNAGDIYRSMTESSPDYGYIGTKVTSLSKYLGADNTGDFREYKQLMAMPDYKPKRDKYMRNLAELKVLTVKAYIDLKRKDVMLDALELIRGIVLWFESMQVRNPPKRALEKLAGSLERFFPSMLWPEQGSNPGNPERSERVQKFVEQVSKGEWWETPKVVIPSEEEFTRLAGQTDAAAGIPWKDIIKQV
ncbi:unnamed protein product, partial [marine sediment metagenome]